MNSNFREEKLFIENKYGEKLVGLCATPNIRKENYKTIILVHGFMVTKHEGYFDEIIKLLVSKNYVVFRFDFSGCGESEGDYSRTSITKLKEDLSSIFDYVKNQSFVDKENISIIAQSMGVPVSLALSPKIKSIILVAPGYNLSKFMKRFELNSEANMYERLSSSRGIIKVSSNFFTEFRKYNFFSSCSGMLCPVLIIGAEQDKKIDSEDVKTLYYNITNPKELHMVSGADHEFIGYRKELFSIVLNWLEKY